MTISTYFDSIENTEQEQNMLAQFSKGLSEAKDELAKAENFPIAGKIIKAIVALSQAESISEFKQTKHYANIKNWDINVEQLEKGNIQINPGEVHKEAAIDILAIVLAVLFGFWLGRKFGKKRCK